MSELLFRISIDGLIKQQYICKSCESSRQSQSIHSFLHKDIYHTLKEKMEENINDFLIKNISIDSEPHYIYIHQIGNQYLFYANIIKGEDCINSINNLISAFAQEYMQPVKNNKEEQKFLFDSIQKLNNDLVNKQREKTKLNQELNRVNKILNNRLVKDPLTKLVSRYQYADEIQLYINKNPKAYGLFWFIDIDDFKKVNDTYGHQIGDSFLVEIANRLNKLPFNDTVKMRIAGDEFGIFIANIKEINESIIEDYYKTFSDIVIKPIVINGNTIPFSCSTGIAIYNKDSSELHQLIDYADYAMYEAKENGKNQFKLFKKNTYEVRN